MSIGSTFNNKVMAQAFLAPSSYFLNKSLCEPVRVSVNMSALPEIIYLSRISLIIAFAFL